MFGEEIYYLLFVICYLLFVKVIFHEAGQVYLCLHLLIGRLNQACPSEAQRRRAFRL